MGTPTWTCAGTRTLATGKGTDCDLSEGAAARGRRPPAADRPSDPRCRRGRIRRRRRTQPAASRCFLPSGHAHVAAPIPDLETHEAARHVKETRSVCRRLEVSQACFLTEFRLQCDAQA